MKINKKIMMIFTVLLLFLSISYTGASNQLKSIYECNDRIYLDFSFNYPMIQKRENVFDNIYDVEIEGLLNTNNFNKPCVPVKNIKILIPNKMEFDNIEIVNSERKLIKSDINLGFGKKLFAINEFFPKNIIKMDNIIKSSDFKLIQVVGEFKFRGFPILFINLYPIEYDNINGDLYFYKNIEFIINFKESNNEYSIRGKESDFCLVNDIIENNFHLKTYNLFNNVLKNDELDYVIITNENLKNSIFEYNFQTLIESKINRGLSSKIFTVEEIISNPDYFVNGTWGDNNPDNPFYESEINFNYNLFNDTQAKIRNFIRYVYFELGVDYVLLGGDADSDNYLENIIPVRGLFANESGLPLFDSGIVDEEEDDIPSDLYYSNLDGNFNYDLDLHFGESPDRNNLTFLDEADLLSEVYIGRACVDNEDEVANFVFKTLNYQNLKNDPYLSKILFAGEFLGFPGVSAYGGNYKDLIKPIIPSNYNIETLYDRDLPSKWDKSDLIDIINIATPHIINHDGHAYYGYNLRMTNNDIQYLTNDKYFFAYSHGCMAGGFDNPGGYDCIAEYLTVESQNGAFAVIMNSRYGLGSEDSLDSPSQFLDDSFFKALFIEDIRQIGRANHYSKEDNIWQINENGIRWVFYETNLLGDPEISIKNPFQSNIDLIINITNPNNNSLYIFNKKILDLPFINFPLIFGDITIQTEVQSDPEGYIYYVDFYIDDGLKYRDDTIPYEYIIDTRLFGKHKITINAYTTNAISREKSFDLIVFNYDLF
jgi:hypothetical protein